VELTDKGRAALPAIRVLLRQHDQLAGWLNGRREHHQVLAIATGSFGARFYLPRALALFAEQH
jgi:DNA-binding transcriptional LysR family regulator